MEIKSFLRSISFSFPVRLLILHFRSHLLLLAIWVFLSLLMTGTLARFFGVYYLLLTPEYCGKVSFWSFFLTGAAFGALVMIWNLTTYLLSAERFPFLATLEAPFSKFSVNNALIPLSFLIAYIIASTYFQAYGELTPTGQIFRNILGFALGATALILTVTGYLFLTNKNLTAFLKPGEFKPKPGSRILSPGQRLPTMWEIHAGFTTIRVDSYLNILLRPRPVRSIAHYDLDVLEKVFRQNHFNAVLVQIVAVIILIVLGLFMDAQWARIPTGATIFILCSMAMAVVGAIVFWFRRWSLFVFVLLLIIINFTTGLGFFNYRNRAYGLDYRPERRAVYDDATFNRIAGDENLRKDKAATLAILENWRKRNSKKNGNKPKLVFLCVSGGGMRSALWTVKTLQQADKETGGKLLQQAILISGASGGMLGAAYVRELYLRQQKGENFQLYDPVHIENMGKDLLNPVSFAIVANDLFFPLSTFRYGNYTYRKDRGYLLEKQLNENCMGILDKKMAAYREPEAEAIIPIMLVTPYIVNDARRLLISAQGMSYMMRPPDDGRYSLHPEIDGVDYGKLFAGQDADSLSFATALRMNCTYPFILPNVYLPTHPAVEALDAGMRDNYGIMSAVRFVHVFRDWIQENTGGVVFVQIRCWEKVDEIEVSDQKGVVENFMTPFDIATKLTSMQDYDQDNMLALLDDLLGKNRLEVVRFIYRPANKEHEASMSLHLSKREKQDILQSFDLPANKASLEQLKTSLK